MPRNRDGQLWPGIERTGALTRSASADEIKLVLVKDALDECACALLPFLLVGIKVILLLPFRLLYLPTHFNGAHCPFLGASPHPVGPGQGRRLFFLVS